MLKAGIYVDAANVRACGGWSMTYEVLRNFVIAQGAQVLRANTYICRVPGSGSGADSRSMPLHNSVRLQVREVKRGEM
jgi:hypothetical protein